MLSLFILTWEPNVAVVTLLRNPHSLRNHCFMISQTVPQLRVLPQSQSPKPKSREINCEEAAGKAQSEQPIQHVFRVKKPLGLVLEYVCIVTKYALIIVNSTRFPSRFLP